PAQLSTGHGKGPGRVTPRHRPGHGRHLAGRRAVRAEPAAVRGGVPDAVQLARHLGGQLAGPPVGLPQLRNRREQPQQLVSPWRPTATAGTTTTTPTRAARPTASTAGGSWTSPTSPSAACSSSVWSPTWCRAGGPSREGAKVQGPDGRRRG